ncbi:Aste57867_16154 [Aphanomyces stellatus]|uniref:Aste57867_16154 protein n=1 Tax=Aphanomyces stellatus TaxID=120398 RepID=A0A485L646_9STRA|nr:hypothetical protein As57867_016098 [Aphanomyces stellatus]VFT92934.1 Aste57867_16154 [Aphanomyces stellatus]
MSPTITHAKKEDKSNSLISDGGKFNIYKVRIQAKLRGKGLWTVVSGEYTREDAEVEDDFDSKEDKAFDILVNSLDDDNLAYASHVTTEVWDMLVTRYEARTTCAAAYDPAVGFNLFRSEKVYPNDIISKS